MIVKKIKEYSHFFPYAFIALCLVVVFGPVLFFGKVFFGEEQQGFYYTTSYLVHQKLQAQEPLQWISSYFGGVSASLDQFIGAYYPLNLFLFKHFNSFTAHHLSILIASIAALWLAYVFGRLQGWRVESSLLFSFGYFSATSFTLIQIGTIVAHGMIVFPALLIALELADRKRYIPALIIGSLGLGVGFLAGFMQAIFYYLVCAGFYALFLDIQRIKDSAGSALSFFGRFRASILLVAVVVLALLIGGRQIYPSIHLIDLTIRTSTYAAQHALSFSPAQLTTLILPPYFSIPYAGGSSTPGLYVGSFGLVMALVCLLFYRTRKVIFFAGLFALLGAFAFHLPIFGWLNEHVPPFSHMGANLRWLIPGAIPLSFLAAAGLDGLLRNPEKISRRSRIIIFWCTGAVAAALVLLSVGVGVLSVYVANTPQWIDSLISWYGSTKSLAHPAEFYRPLVIKSLFELAAMFSLASWGFLAAVGTWCIALMGLWALFFSRYGTWTKAAVSFIVVSVVFLLPIAAQWSELVPHDLYKQEPLLAKAILDREDDSHSYRMMGYLLGDGLFYRLSSKTVLTPAETTSIQNQIISNNSNIYWGIERMDGMEPYRTLRINRLLNTVIAHDFAVWVFDRQSPALPTAPLDKLYNREVQKLVTLPQKLVDFRNRVSLLGMMNVKYVYSPYQLTSPAITFVSEIPIVAGMATTSVYLYQIHPVLPRLYVAKNPQFVRDERSALLKVIDEQDFKNHTYIECLDCGGDTSSGSVTVLQYKDGDVYAQAHMEADGWVVFSENALPGWHAEVDGIEVPIRTANYLFQGVPVPAGEHKVHFFYKDVSLFESNTLSSHNSI